MTTQQLAEYLETYGPKSNIDRTALLAATELRRLHEENERLKAQQQEPTLQEQLDDALQSLDFYRRRVQALQQWQSKMRDPERTIVCDIIANGCALEPAGDRYKLVEQQKPVAWMHTNAIGHVYFRKNPQDKTLNPVPLYTSPPASKPWRGLTDEEMKAVHRNAGVTYLVPADYDRHLFTHMTDVQLMKISSAIEAKLREKNT